MSRTVSERMWTAAEGLDEPGGRVMRYFAGLVEERYEGRHAVDEALVWVIAVMSFITGATLGVMLR